jgi:fido (protein-threonine AMPylation protein)
VIDEIANCVETLVAQFRVSGINLRKFAVYNKGSELEIYDDNFNIVHYTVDDGFLIMKSLGFKIEFKKTYVIRKMPCDVVIDAFSSNFLECGKYQNFVNKVLFSDLRAEFSRFETPIINELPSLDDLFDDKILNESPPELDIIYNSNTIEGIRVSKQETADILSGKVIPRTRDELEVKNLKEATNYLESTKISEKSILEAHRYLLSGVRETEAGLYRTVDVVVGEFEPIPSSCVRSQMEQFEEWLTDLKSKEIHPVIRASLLHAQFVKIHPFADGNGRIARLIMNKSLSEDGFGRINIKAKNKQKYYDTLCIGHTSGDYTQFVKFVASESGYGLPTLL